MQEKTGPPQTLSCDALLFDLDGVLVDSTTCIDRHWRRWARQHGLDEDTVVQIAHGRRSIETVRLAAPHLPAQQEADAMASTASVDTEGVFVMKGALALLQALPRNRWAIVTSGARLTATTRIRHTGLPTPSVLITAEAVSRGKPAPEGYLRAAEQLGVAPEHCVVLEDAPAGIEAAHAAGMRVIGITATSPPAQLLRADYRMQALTDLHVSCNTNSSSPVFTLHFYAF